MSDEQYKNSLRRKSSLRRLFVFTANLNHREGEAPAEPLGVSALGKLSGSAGASTSQKTSPRSLLGLVGQTATGGGHHCHAGLAGFAETGGGDVGGLQVVENDLLGSHQLTAHAGDF